MIATKSRKASQYRCMRKRPAKRSMLQFPPGVPVFAAAPRPQAQPAVVPQLALRTETMRCLNESDQKGDPDRAQRGNLFEELTGGMLSAFRQQLLPRFLPYPHQKVELSIGLLSPTARSFLQAVDLLIK
jgi:hypothetical protein